MTGSSRILTPITITSSPSTAKRVRDVFRHPFHEPQRVVEPRLALAQGFRPQLPVDEHGQKETLSTPLARATPSRSGSLRVGAVGEVRIVGIEHDAVLLRNAAAFSGVFAVDDMMKLLRL